MSWPFKPGFIIHKKITWLLLFLIITLGISSWLIYISKETVVRTNTRINDTYEIIGMARQTLLALQQPGSDPTPFRDSLLRLSQENQDQLNNQTLLAEYPLTNLSAAQTAALQSLLNSIIREERTLLVSRKAVYDEVTRRIATGLIIGRIGAFLFVIVILLQLNKDITHRKKAQEQLVIAIREAMEAKLMQEQFLANMSHEIRTPMNGIKGMTDLLLDTPLSSKQQELTGIIKSSVNNLLVIINDILDFSKIKAGKLNIEDIDFSPAEVLNNVTALFEHRLKKKGLALHINLDPKLPRWLIGDPHRLNQVLINVLGNAIKFTDEGSVTMQVGIQYPAGIITGKEEKVILTFTITDTGIGIPPGSLPHIFDSFSQGGQDTSRRYGGTGLGLTICKQLLHLQGGDISASSIPGEGSVFTFHLPYTLSREKNQGTPETVQAQDHSNLLKGRRFLVAEDNEINQKLIDYVLTKAGGTVELVSNGAEAIQQLQRGENFDLIIMDLQMPEMDGYMATRYIRNDLRLQTPIIAMTATAMKGEQLQCIESGMNEYMTKPFEFAELYKRINTLLS